MRALLVWLLLTGTAAAQGGVVGSVVGGLPGQPPQPRDPRVALTGGKGVVRGRVTAADTGNPMRQATVTISGPGQRSTYTDADGRYQFTGLPPGRYTISAVPGNHRPTYQRLMWGSRGNGPGRPIQLDDGQVIDNVDVALPRAGVIAGRVFDPYGEPAARVNVFPMLVRFGGEPVQVGPSAMTDDLGQFRLFGLQPGTYLVRADIRMGMFSVGPGDVEGEPLGFATTYAPGTPSRTDALRIRVAAGSEAATDIRLIESRMFRIAGSVLTMAGEPAKGIDVSLVQREFGSSSSFGSSAGPNGTFTFRNVSPGTYEIVARLQAPRTMTPGQPIAPPSVLEMGSVRVDVTTDLENVTVVMRPGETVAGEIVFDDVAPEDFRASINLQPIDRLTSFSSAPLTVDGSRFTARDLFGTYVIRGGVTGGGGPWFLKAVLLNGRDITDVPTAFSSAHSGHLQVVFTSRGAALEGTVTDDSGKPTREAQVFIFGADEESWTPFSSRTRPVMFKRDQEGTFATQGLRDGRYYVIALPAGTAMMGGSQALDRGFMEQLKKVATEVVLNPGETRTVDLRVVRIEQ
jgi:protocatechuate 3,4-dioxygenase beta subunit